MVEKYNLLLACCLIQSDWFLRRLLDAGVTSEGIPSGSKLLHEAARYGSAGVFHIVRTSLIPECLEATLVSGGAFWECFNSCEGNAEVLSYYTQMCAKSNLREAHESSASGPADLIQSPLTKAISRDHLQSLRILLENGVFPLSTTTGKTNSTLLMLCLLLPASGAAKKCLRYLVTAMPDALDNQDDIGRTAFLHACHQRHKDEIRLLVESGANAAVVDRDGRTGLHLLCEAKPRSSATSGDDLAIAEYLVEKCGIDADQADHFGKTAAQLCSDICVKQYLQSL